MRAYVPDYTLERPADLEQALALLAHEPGRWAPFAGGTDLMVLFEAGKLTHREYLSLWHLDELRGIVVEDAHVTLGALTTFSEVRDHPVLQRELPNFCSAATLTAAVAIQNRGTIGGNIANASPAADTPPALLVYGAEIELRSATGGRWVDYAGFHTGYKATMRRPDELITRVRVPRAYGAWLHHYRKVGARKAQAISKVCLAAAARVSAGHVAEARLALASVAPVPLRCRAAEAALCGRALDEAVITEARRALEGEITPIDDVRSTAEYRRHVAGNLLTAFLRELASDVGLDR